MASIHPSSVIDPSAEFGQNVEVGPMCYVGPNVNIGDNSRLVSHVCVFKNTTIGKDNNIWPHATIGSDPQDLKFKDEQTTLTIGDRNLIRESVTIHRGTGKGGGITTVGNDNMFMVGSHIAHDCHIADHILLANNVLLAGHIIVEDHVSMLGASAAHHYTTIGRYSYISGMSRISHDVPPYMIVQGYSARAAGRLWRRIGSRGVPPDGRPEIRGQGVSDDQMKGLYQKKQLLSLVADNQEVINIIGKPIIKKLLGFVKAI